MTDYIARAKAAQQKHDERPGTQLAIASGWDDENRDWADPDYGRLPTDNPNHDDDPGDCTDHRGS